MGAATFVAEHSPEGRRAFLTSFIQVSTTLAILAGAGTASLLIATLSPEAMNDWGWRVPFLVAGPLGVISLYIRCASTSRRSSGVRSRRPAAPRPCIRTLCANR